MDTEFLDLWKASCTDERETWVSRLINNTSTDAQVREAVGALKAIDSLATLPERLIRKDKVKQELKERNNSNV